MATARQGQSQATQAKQEALASFISAHSNTVQVIQQKHSWAGPYCYIETNAGCGWNHKVDVIGSPLVALQVFQQRSLLKRECTFIEKDKAASEQLCRRVVEAGGTESMVINGDHCKVLPEVVIPRSAYGLVYADPNALKDSPEEALRTFFQRKETKMLDLLINLDAHMRRRVVAGQEKGGTPGNYDDLGRLMRRIGKEHWWIRQPYICAGSKWTFLFGSNSKNIKIGSLGKVDLPMFHVNDRRGQLILADLMGEIRLGKATSSRSPYRTYKDYLAHPSFQALRTEVMRRNGGKCELCNHKVATEIHHRVYPRWGEFDHPDALLALCHACHCHVHGVTE